MDVENVLWNLCRIFSCFNTDFKKGILILTDIFVYMYRFIFIHVTCDLT